MRRALTIHRDSRSLAVSGINVTARRIGHAALRLDFLLTGDLASIRLPGKVESARADGLWRSTCFEIFLRPEGSNSYYEFNFSPSTQWAAYMFESYRHGMQVLDGIVPPPIAIRLDDRHFVMDASLELDTLAPLAGCTVWHAGVSAIIEETDGSKSYWALAHPSGRPDFHHQDGFALEVGTVTK